MLIKIIASVRQFCKKCRRIIRALIIFIIFFLIRKLLERLKKSLGFSGHA